MICEFALDPELVARWHDPKEWAFFREAFAAETGRVGSRYPKKWQQEVRKRFRESHPNATEASQDWQRMDALLQLLSNGMVERESSHQDCPTWLGKAVAEHRERPFDGILSATSYESVPEVITPDMLFLDNPPTAWKVSQRVAVQRTVEGFTQALTPLLTRCKEAVFVDPHFDPNKPRFRDSLGSMLKVLWGPGSCVSEPKAQLIMAEGTNFNKKDDHRDASWLLTECKNRLPRMLPAGRSLKVTVLRERQGGEKIHNRYVLTKLAGVSFGIGLDVSNDDETGHTDDLCRLSSDQLKLRWGQYVTAHRSYFDIAAGPQEIFSSYQERNKR